MGDRGPEIYGLAARSVHKIKGLLIDGQTDRLTD